MSVLKINLRSGVAQLAQFTGIGKGLKPAAKPARVQPFVAIGGGKPAAQAAKKPVAENPDDPPAPDDGGDDPDDDGDDDEAMGDDDYGADAPSDDDSPEEVDAKRARRVARRARRMKNADPAPPSDPPPSDDTPSPPDDDAEDGDDGDAEMRGNSPVAAARRRERARCAAIFGTRAAASNVELAAHLAFNTNMTRGQVIKALSTAPAKAGSELGDAMRGYAAQRPGSPPAPEKSSGQKIAASWDAAFDEATAYRGGRKK